MHGSVRNGTATRELGSRGVASLVTASTEAYIWYLWLEAPPMPGGIN
jgi:hypothetical protein